MGQCGNAAMRRAVNHIIDRNQTVNVAIEGAIVPSETMFVQSGSMAPYVDAAKAAGYGLSPTRPTLS